MSTAVLHVCCGPCASACVPRLRADGYEPVMLFANSNIDTREEFARRLAAAERLAAADGCRFVALPYDHGEWLREVAAGFEYEPEQGARCARCFRYNLAKAAAFAKANGIGAYTTSLTVSPHKVNAAVFAAAPQEVPGAPRFLPLSFKANGGFLVSLRRARELDLYRQSYCGCEFSKFRWHLHEKDVTDSTNRDARGGRHGDVFIAREQTAGRGRLGHAWVSAAGENLTMSVVLSVVGCPLTEVATLPLVIGLAVAEALPASAGARIKWPNDVLCGGRKIAGILCERVGETVIAGIGLNVQQRVWSADLAARATSLELATGRAWKVSEARRAVLAQLGKWYGIWRDGGFAAIHPHLAARDWLKGCLLAVRQTDDDREPVRGVCGGIAADGALVVDGVRLYAGEAHVLSVRSAELLEGGA